MLGTLRAASENDKQSGRCTQGEKVGDKLWFYISDKTDILRTRITQGYSVSKNRP